MRRNTTRLRKDVKKEAGYLAVFLLGLILGLAPSIPMFWNEVKVVAPLVFLYATLMIMVPLMWHWHTQNQKRQRIMWQLAKKDYELRLKRNRRAFIRTMLTGAKTYRRIKNI